MDKSVAGFDVMRRQLGISLWSAIAALALVTPGGLATAAAATSPAAAPTAGPPLKIGIIGTGRIGSALARHWAKAGHELMISSRHPDTLKPLAAELGAKVHVGTPQEAAAFGEVILVATPNGALAQIGQDYAKELAGKVIIDTSNAVARGAAAAGAERKVLGVADAETLNTRRLVRAFNCINSYAVTTDAFRPGSRRAIPIASDDAAALDVARRLVSDAGFDAFVVGSLERSRDFELYEILAQRDWNAGEFERQAARLATTGGPAAR
jgi:predicted dinucleotide-binding enzyme